VKIGLLSFEYPPETGFGGIGTYTWYQARALARLGHEVHVLGGSRNETSLYTREHDGVLVHRFRPGGFLMSAFGKLDRWKCYWTKQRLENAWGMYEAMKMLARRHKFDVLEMPECGAEGALINSRLDIPTVVKFHSPSKLIMPFYDVPEADIRWCSRVEQKGILDATTLMSCSAYLADEVRTKMAVTQPIQVVANGIDLKLFDEDVEIDVAKKYGIPTDKPVIFFAGRMERRKGIHLCGPIVEAILRKHDVAFVFAGQDLFGYMEKTLLPSVKNQNLRGSVHYIGKLDLPELRACVRSADIFMLPSLWENCPYSCLEAMAAGRAIVSSDQGGMPELIQHGENGLLARCDDSASFVEQIEKLIEDSELRRRLGAAARRTVELRYTDDHIAGVTQGIYQAAQQSVRS
jgi:glycosyltransferase involved in cell wall biosynthesis